MPVPITDHVLEGIGNTPMVRLRRIARGVKPDVLAKLEMRNPGGSVKDRIALAMIRDAEKRGVLKPGGTIVEPTSGNTGCGLAVAACVLGYKAIFTMPDKMSQEKINLLKAYGARVVVTPTNVAADSPESFYSVARRLAQEIPGGVLLNQYENQCNPEAHYRSSGPEIWEQTQGRIDCFVAGLGTGGTISGTGRFLKEKKPGVRIVGVDPQGSILAHYFRTREMCEAAPYKVEGIGEDLIPATTHFQYVDEMITVSDRESFIMARRLAREEGILAGGSSGSAVVAALRVAATMEEGQMIVVLFPDTGERYLSKVHSDEWMRENFYHEEDHQPLAEVLRAKRDGLPALVSVSPTDLVGHAIDLMEKNWISQLPILEGGRQVGSVEEVSLIRRLHEDRELTSRPVRDVMEASFPEISEETDIEEAFRRFEEGAPAVLVTAGSEIRNILTKTDLLHYYRGKE